MSVMKGRDSVNIEDATIQKLLCVLSTCILATIITLLLIIYCMIRYFQVQRNVDEVSENAPGMMRRVPRLKLKRAKEMYQQICKEYGEESPIALELGVNYANRMMEADLWLEGERLLLTLNSISRRVLGVYHDTRTYVEAAIAFYKTRRVMVKSENAHQYEFLNYDNSDYGHKCVIKGPIVDAVNRDTKQEKVQSINFDDLRIILGTPVVLRGMDKGQKHLSGKLAVILEWNDEADPFTYQVTFEDNRYEPCNVEPKNVRIVFDLPAKRH